MPANTATSAKRFSGITELVDLVFLCILGGHDSKCSLQNCSRVSRSWCSIAQPRLFSIVTLCALEYRTVFVDFHQFILSTPHFGPAIRTLGLHGRFRTRNGGIYYLKNPEDLNVAVSLSLLKHLLEALPRLRDLSPSSLLFDDSDPSPTSLSLCPSRINTLSVCELVTRPYQSLQAAMDIFHLFSSINICKINKINNYWNPPDQQPHHFAFPEDIKIATLCIGPEIRDNEFQRMSRGMLQSSSLMCSISSIEMEISEFVDLDIFGEFFQVVGPRVRSLTMDVYSLYYDWGIERGCHCTVISLPSAMFLFETN